MTQQEIKGEQSDFLDRFCEDMGAYLTTAGDEKRTNLNTMKRHFHEMMDELLVNMFERKIRAVLIANINKTVNEKSEEIGEKLNEKATGLLTDTLYNFRCESSDFLRQAESIVNQADVTKIKGIVEELQRDAEGSIQNLEKRRLEVDRRIANLLKITPLEEAIRATLLLLREQGIEMSSAETVEIIKSIVDYQSKVVEKESYENWQKIREDGLTARRGR